MAKTTYKINSKIWIYQGHGTHSPSAKAAAGAWHFINIPKKESAAIKKSFGADARGWGSLPVEAVIGKTKWTTSIFPDNKSGEYLLPLKAQVRKKEDLESGDDLTFTIKILQK